MWLEGRKSADRQVCVDVNVRKAKLDQPPHEIIQRLGETMYVVKLLHDNAMPSPQQGFSLGFTRNGDIDIRTLIRHSDVGRGLSHLFVGWVLGSFALCASMAQLKC
jgi:hypothetical protein